MPSFDADQIRRDNTLDSVVQGYGIALKRDGREWRACCPLHQERTPSFTVYPSATGQRFCCFGCGERGDVIDFVQAYERCDFTTACEILGGTRTRTSRPAVPVAPAAPVITYSPPPADAPVITAGKPTPPIWNEKRGKSVTYRPSLVHEYPGHGYVLRVDIEDGRKLTPAVLWDGSRWCHGSMPTPRPLYGLQELLDAPTRQALVVEGEKCRDVATATLQGLAAVSWCGGGKAAGKTDWTPLSGRRVVVWPDNDDAGQATAQEVARLALEAGAAEVKLLSLEGLDKPKGWDIADAVSDDWWGRDELTQFMRSRARVIAREEVVQSDNNKSISKPDTRPRQQITADGAAAPPPPKRRQPVTRDNVTSLHGAPIPAGDDLDDFRSHMHTDEDGKIKPKLLTNWYWMLRGHPETRHVFAFNEVAQSVFLMRASPWDKRDKPRALTDDDIGKAAMWLEGHGMTPKKSDAREAIKAVAGHATFNPIREYLNGLKWDGVPRLAGGRWESDTIPHGAAEYLGAPDDAIFGTFLTKWHVSAVARIMSPGCKADCMLITEGEQGKFKSTYFREMATVGGYEYFTDNIADITQKDSIMLMQGRWIVENAEMSGFNRQELNHVKAWLSRTTDRYIPKYESEQKEIPRSFVVAGTHNPTGHGFLKDPTGNRRFWPMPVVKIEIERVRQEKDQIWAEAVSYYRKGMQWWLTPDEQTAADALTEDRRSVDPWAYKLEPLLGGLARSVTMKQALDALGMPAHQQSELTVKRLAEFIRGSGWVSDGPDKFVRRTPDVA